MLLLSILREFALFLAILSTMYHLMVNFDLCGNFGNVRLEGNGRVEFDLCSLHQDYYFVGKYGSDRENFIPDVKFKGICSNVRFDYGRFYGLKSFYYAKNWRILWAWMSKSFTKLDDIQKGWAGVQ